MADATQGDTDLQYLGLPALALIALIAGLLIHSFIIGVNVSDWWEGRSVTAVDQVITSLGMSRMCSQCVDTLYLILDTPILSRLKLHLTLLIMDAVYDFFTYTNIWLTSLLSVVFCLKISNFHSRLFLYLRGLITHRTGYLIVASGLFSACNCFSPLMLIIIEATKGGTYNTSMDTQFNHCIYSSSLYAYTIGVFLPVLFYCLSSVLLFSSLYHHTTKMKRSSNLSISLERYYSIMRFVSITFIYNTLLLICYIVCVFYYYFYCLNIQWLYIVLDILPILHSSYLIYRTAKLRSQMSKIIKYVTDFSMQREDTDTRENIEIVAQ